MNITRTSTRTSSFPFNSTIPNSLTTNNRFPPQNKHQLHLVVTNSTTQPQMEIRVCVNRTCAKQGSRETLETLSSLAPPHVSVTSCGCLGKCGSGPNLAFLPQSVFISHCSTAARAAQVLAAYLGKGDDGANNLASLALRKRAEEEMDNGCFVEAVDLLSQAIDLKPSGGLHIIYKARSSARLALGDNLGALEDANTSVALASEYRQAYLCQGDAFLALEDFSAAENSYSIALQIDPTIRRSKSFKVRVTKLQDKLAAANMVS